MKLSTRGYEKYYDAVSIEARHRLSFA